MEVDIEGGMWRVEVDIEGGMWRVEVDIAGGMWRMYPSLRKDHISFLFELILTSVHQYSQDSALSSRWSEGD